MNDSRSLMRNSAHLLGQIVGRLDNKVLEHHHRIEWWSPAVRSVRVAERHIQFCAE